MFLGFLARFGLWITGVLFLRALFFTLTGENKIQEAWILFSWYGLGHALYCGCLFHCFGHYVSGGWQKRTQRGWEMGKGLIAPTM